MAARAHRTYALLTGIVLSIGSACASAQPAESEAVRGAKLFEATCAECHESAQLKGDAALAFGPKIQQIVAGKAKHRPKLKLSAEDATAVAAFLTSQK